MTAQAVLSNRFLYQREQKVRLDNSYYQDEVREGFYIPGMIKRCWASQMEILERVNDICEKHGIRWFADYGTLLGAVRHHGFIPWDDDLDICMLKDDYDRFLEVAGRELPDGYRVLNIYTEPTYNNFLTRIVNHEVIDTRSDFLEKNHGFPYVSGIDIFPLHYLSSDEKKENEKQSKANEIFRLLENFLKKRTYTSADESALISNIERISGLKIGKYEAINNAVYRVLDSMFSDVSSSDAAYVCLTRFWIERKSHRFPISIYRDTVKLPFETGYINAPAGYELLLRNVYGNWEKANRAGGLHDYPFYLAQEQELEKHLSGGLPYKYSFDVKDIECTEKNDNDPAGAILATMQKAHLLLNSLAGAKEFDKCAQLMPGCQELAVKLAEDIEKEFLADGSDTVSLLEEYCEYLYLLHESALEALNADTEAREDYDESANENDQNTVEGDTAESNTASGNAAATPAEMLALLEVCFGKIKESYKCLKESEVVFIVTKPELLDKIRRYIGAYRKSEACLIRIMPVPYYEKNWNGELSCEKYEYESIKERLIFLAEKDRIFDDISVLDYRSYDYPKHFPETVLSDPFGQYEEACCIHPFFIPSNLRKHSRRLSYVHTLSFSVPCKGDEKGMANLRRPIVSPAVVMSDMVLVPDEEVKNLYLDILMNECNSVDPGYWENKIAAVSDMSESKWQKNAAQDTASILSDRKYILFYVSFSSFYTHRENVLKKLETVIGIFADNKDRIRVKWISDASFEEDMKKICPELFESFLKIVAIFREKDLGEYITSGDADFCKGCSAYYGSGGFFLNECVNKSIPSMIWNADVK